MDIGIGMRLMAFNLEALNDNTWQYVGMHMFWDFLVDEIGCIVTVEWLGYDDPTFHVKYDNCHRKQQQAGIQCQEVQSWVFRGLIQTVDLEMEDWDCYEALHEVWVSHFAPCVSLLLVRHCSVRAFGNSHCLQLPGKVHMVVQALTIVKIEFGHELGFYYSLFLIIC
jgi:hypothetical protein